MSDFKFAFSFPDASGDVDSDVEVEEGRTNAYLETTTSNTFAITSVASEDHYECHPPSLDVSTSPLWRKLQTPGGLSFEVVDTSARGWSNEIIEGLPEGTDLVSGNDYEHLLQYHMYRVYTSA